MIMSRDDLTSVFKCWLLDLLINVTDRNMFVIQLPGYNVKRYVTR